MERKEAIRSAYRQTGESSFYDGMITCSTLSGKAVCRLVWAMNKAENDDYLEKALSGIPEHFSGRLLEVPVGTGVAVSAELCSGCHALCGGRGVDSGNVAGAALESWHGILCGRIQRHDDDGCGFGIRRLMMILQVFLEGIGLGVLLILVCTIGIRKGAVGMVHLYSPEVQNRCITLRLTTHEKIKRNALLFKAICVPGYIAYVLVCVYAVNGARGFLAGFWQMLVILSVMNLIDRFLIDGYWVGHTNAWTIPGTEDLKPYITTKDKAKKWLFGTVGMAVISAVLAAIMMLFMKI